jgi:membrane protein implicated in regulation of membrane protease activity
MMPQQTHEANSLLGAFATIIGACFTFFLDNWIEFVTLAFSAIALFYTIKNARASFRLKTLEIQHEQYEIQLKKIELSKLKNEVNQRGEITNEKTND